VIIEAPVILGDSLTGPEGEDAVAVPLAGVQRVESRALHPGAVLMSVFVIAGTVVGFVLVDDGGDAPLD
jgi:zinc transporter ZupT